jgi:hypothetical protein
MCVSQQLHANRRASEFRKFRLGSLITRSAVAFTAVPSGERPRHPVFHPNGNGRIRCRKKPPHCCSIPTSAGAAFLPKNKCPRLCHRDLRVRTSQPNCEFRKMASLCMGPTGYWTPSQSSACRRKDDEDGSTPRFTANTPA